MQANYRIIKIGKKYFPQTRFQHVVTVEKHHNIQPIHDWIYFKDPHGEDQWFKTYDEALQACIDDEKSEKIDAITEIEIKHGDIIQQQIIR